MLQKLNKKKKIFLFFNKSQISVFILIAVLILFLFAFMLFIGNDDDKGNLKDSKNAVILHNKQELSTLKSAMDHCLELELKKALIVSGLRGGFIYNKGEYYFPGSIPSNTYSQTLIANLGLNWNNLQSRTLVHSQAQVYPPGIDKDVFMYNHSIKDDIEKYISKEFVDCLNFENTKDAFSINFTDYLGTVKQIDFDNKMLEIYNINAEIGDKIDVDIPSQTISGIVKEYLMGTNSFLVEFDNVTFLQDLTVEQMANLDVINMNRSLNLTVNINNEDVSANLNFPLSIKNNKFETSYQDTTVTAPVRYKSLLALSKELLTHKYLNEKNIDYMESDNVLRVLNNSKYFQTTNLLNLSFSKKILIDEKEHKRYIYTLIDKDSRILGNPFVFNFGYENIAPHINFSFIDPSLVLAADDKVITLLSTENDEIHYNLRNFTFEKQFWDDYILYYEEEYYYGNDSEFVLTKEGDLHFKPYLEKVYRHNIHVTDGETTREHILEFVTGFPDNTGNKAAPECFSFVNSEDLYREFPISFIYKNKVFDYSKDGELVLFGLVSYVPNNVMSGFEPGILYFSKSCVFDTSKFEISVNAIAPDGTNTTLQVQDFGTKLGVKIPNREYIQEIKVKVSSIFSGTVMTDPYTFFVVPARCLGPADDDTALKLTCCDMDKIKQTVSNAQSSKNVKSINLVSSSNLLSGNTIYEKEIYMCFNPDRSDILNIDGFDYERNRIWDIDERITSLFKTRMKLVCQGTYPMPEHNVEQVGEPTGDIDVVGEVVAIKNAGIRTDIVSTVPLRLDIVEPAGSQCTICEISNFTSFGLVANIFGAENIVFRVGEVDGNQGNMKPYVGPIPGTQTSGWSSLNYSTRQEYNNLFLLCEDEWEMSEDGGITWFAVPFMSTGDRLGFETFRQHISISKKYCGQNDDGICEGRIGSPTSNDVNDATEDTANCNNYYFRYNDLGEFEVLSDVNTGWLCIGEHASSCERDPPDCEINYTYNSNQCYNGRCMPAGTDCQNVPIPMPPYSQVECNPPGMPTCPVCP